MADEQKPLHREIDELLKEMAQITAAPAGSPAREPGRPAATATLELLKEIALNVRVELGRTRMTVEDVLRLGPGSVVELDRLAGEPVDLYVNDRLAARGELIVVEEQLGVRISEVSNFSPTPEK